MVDLEATVPFPQMPGGRLDPGDEVIVDEEDMEFVPVPPKRGRPRKACNQELLSEVLRLYFIEKKSMRQIAAMVGVSHMSVYRMLSDPTLELLI